MTPSNQSDNGADDRAVAPVLGIALIIAITVILAGVVGFIVLGVDAGANSAPNAELKFSQTENATGHYDITVAHEGGDKLKADDVHVVITDNSGDADSGSFSEDLTAGNELQIVTNDTESGDIVRVTWNDPNSDKTAVLGEYRVE